MFGLDIGQREAKFLELKNPKRSYQLIDISYIGLPARTAPSTEDIGKEDPFAPN